MLEKLGAVVVFTDIGNGSSLDGRDQLKAALRLLEPGDEIHALASFAMLRASSSSKQALDSSTMREGSKEVLLGPAQLYEALRARAGDEMVST